MFKRKLLFKLCAFAICLPLIMTLAACGGGGLTVKDDDDYVIPATETDAESDTSDTSFAAPVQSDTIITETEPVIDTAEDTAPEDDASDLNLSAAVENKITMTAESLLGIPFADGGSSPDAGFDNSGFIYYVLKQNGYVNCPRGLAEQAAMGVKVSDMNDLKSGDLVFFSENGENAQFGGIYKGDGVMITCQVPGQTVKETDISINYYVNNFFTGVRVL